MDATTDKTRKRVERAIAEVCTEICDEIAVEDRIPVPKRALLAALTLRAVLGSFREVPLTVVELAFAELPEAQMRAALRTKLEPTIRTALAELRTN